MIISMVLMQQLSFSLINFSHTLVHGLARSLRITEARMIIPNRGVLKDSHRRCCYHAVLSRAMIVNMGNCHTRRA